MSSQHLIHRDVEILSAVFQTAKDPDALKSLMEDMTKHLDFDNVATVAGLKKANSARASWGKVRCKILDGAPPAPAIAPQKRRAKKEVAATDAGDTNAGDDDDDAAVSPNDTMPRTKRAKTAPVATDQPNFTPLHLPVWL